MDHTEGHALSCAVLRLLREAFKMGKVKFLPTFSRPPPPHPKWAFTSIELYSNPMPSHTGTDWSVVSFGKAWFNSPHPWLFVELRVVDILNNVVMNTIWKAEITTVRSIKTQKFKDLLGKGCHRIPNIWYLVPIHYLVQLWPRPMVVYFKLLFLWTILYSFALVPWLFLIPFNLNV